VKLHPAVNMEVIKYDGIKKHVNEQGVNGYLCLVCDYFNDRKSHTYKHYERIHMLNGRPCNKKRKYKCGVPEEAEKSYHQRTCSIGTHVFTECSHRARIREEGAERRLKKKEKKDLCSSVIAGSDHCEMQQVESCEAEEGKDQDSEGQAKEQRQQSVDLKENGVAFEQYVKSLRGTQRESDIVNEIFGMSMASVEAFKNIDRYSKEANKKKFCVLSVGNKKRFVIHQKAVQNNMHVLDMQTVSMPELKSEVTNTVLTFGISTIEWKKNECLGEPKSPVVETATSLPYDSADSNIVGEIGFFGSSL